MADDGPSPTTTAQPPFDDVDADIVLQTSDHYTFRVYRLILTLSSPFFQGMFSLPQPPDNNADADDKDKTKNGRSPSGASKPPVIDISEDSKTLDTLLRFLYPNTPLPTFHSIAHARSVAIAASKYDMAVALQKIADAIQAEYVASHPFHVYFFACRMGWEGVARAAAKQCLDPERIPGEEFDGDDLLHWPGAGVAYHRLETYRTACRRALEKKLDRMDLFDDEDEDCDCEDSEYDSEDCDKGISDHCLGNWMKQYVTNIRETVSECPRKDKLDDISLAPDVSCRRCNIEKAYTIATARQEVASRIDDVLSEVRWTSTNATDTSPLTNTQVELRFSS